MAPVINVRSVNYPESDGRPMGESDLHRDEMIRQLQLLRRYYAGQRVYVSGDLLVYYQQGDPKKFIVPDVFVVKGLEPKQRRVYKLWVESMAPDVVLEVTSKKTRKKDAIIKPALYERLGVKEYFLFDPTHDYLDPPLQGHRLVGGGYRDIAADSSGALQSDELELRLQVERGHLMFYRLDNGQRLLTAEEALQGEKETLQAEAEARQAAEMEVARLREQLRRLGETR